LAPIITDFIRNTKRELYDEKLEDALEMLDVWLDREQKLITVIQEETKCKEEKEEARFRSPTWSKLRALQKINQAKRLEGESIMSAPPFFHSTGRGDLKF